MKKFISILLVMTITITSVIAFAEGTVMKGSFSIRNGIMFGMTVEEIQEIEQNQNGLAKGEWDEKYKKLGFYPESIAGIPCKGGNLPLAYCFDDSEKMNAFSYNYASISDGDLNTYYNELKGLFSEKYGNPLNGIDTPIFEIITPAFEGFAILKAFFSYTTEYSQWLIEFDDNYVFIDMILCDRVDSDTANNIMIGFKCIEKDVIAQMISDAVENEAQKAAERSSDI